MKQKRLISPSFRVLLAFIVFAFSSTSALPEDGIKSPLVVHEWGVMTVGHPGGTPILGATDRYLESLPIFVLRNDLVAASQMAGHQQPLTVWKPVIHLYGQEGQNVEVSVSVTGGYPLVYFPKPKLAGYSTNTGRAPLTSSQSMTWNFSLTKEPPEFLLKPPTDHWWNAARNVPGDYVVMDEGSGSERFLFYEGTTTERPSVSAAVTKKAIVITNTYSAASAPVILIRNDNGSHSGVYLDRIAAGKAATVSAASFKPWDQETLFAQCRKQWEACGMTPEEAVAIVESWRPELLNTPGFLLVSRIPEPVYERMFPIKVNPAPAELTRACLVFDTLAGQHDRKHWVPELSKLGRDTFAELADADFKRRLEAEAKIIGLGEIMLPFGEEILAGENGDPQLRMATATLMRILADSPVCAHPLPERTLYNTIPPLRGPIRLDGRVEIPVPGIEFVPDIDG